MEVQFLEQRITIYWSLHLRKWLGEFNREYIYKSDTEKQLRFEVFKANFQFIESVKNQWKTTSFCRHHQLRVLSKICYTQLHKNMQIELQCQYPWIGVLSVLSHQLRIKDDVVSRTLYARKNKFGVFSIMRLKNVTKIMKCVIIVWAKTKL